MSDQTALFKQYETDYCNKSTDISRKINTIPSLSGEQRRIKTAEIENDIKSADVVIKSMDMEARSLPPSIAQPLLTKVKDYKADLTALKEQMKKAQSASPVGDAARAELGLGGDYYSTSAGQRERMLTATQRMERSTQNLTYAKETLDRTQEDGANILTELQRQRETIERSRNTLQDADDNISKARKVLSSMARRVMQNKIIMAGIILFLLAGIGIILYVKLKK
ncbi:hypothetical protein CEUSTIGMA_g870.t1 [Chlamydomonas eustigma]|uniref:t-SNARE coiled-coil homology domain-containing protein n=1 Tax=Chlamydomonas eustigma TaxID=1157962 RepID=A0A250WRG5_9CHLO|nr:hypothetical protein CEUSTIGMA_g870.t1 [Chlamydomonas eustigma]|eukprot:GAX73418.1 hypothetical protein CEUSTIGMA_g870.t1 [Chlamydomonas eustigma]